MSETPQVSVVIPVFNGWEMTRDCLNSLRGHTAGADYEVVVADNGSGDATATELEPLGRALFGERFRLLRFPENRNFGPACNAGARAAAAPLLFFLNNDTLLTPGWLPPLVQALNDDSSLGGVGPLLLYPGDTVQHLGISFALRTVAHLYSRFPADHPAVRRRRKLQALTAAALLLPKKVFFDAGAFYEEYRNGYEDVDLCLQIRYRLGFSLSCIPESAVVHLESRSAGRRDGEDANSALLTRRCGGTFIPDRHLHGVKDGFEPFISDDFDIRLRMKAADEDALEAEAAGRDLAFRCALARRHPLWAGGRARLIGDLEKAGNGGEAVQFFHELVALRMTAEVCREAALFMARHNEDSSCRYYHVLHRLFSKTRSDRSAARKYLRMTEGRDALLRKLYEDKIHELSDRRLFRDG
ncbi:MAG: glycosyltransferase [Desulfovibrio sp.]|jgi:GT2 family glycosyltransferase|nr:glycosyltransferase [Desulfovibrio sp.]